MKTATAADWPARPAVNHLTYPGDHRHLVEPDQIPLGPNAYGESFFPVIAEFDPETNKTRVGLTPIAPPAHSKEPTHA